MWTKQKTQFIEVAARALWTHEQSTEEPLCDVLHCRHRQSSHSRSDGPCEECAQRAVAARESVRQAKEERGDLANYNPGLRRLDRQAQHAFSPWVRPRPEALPDEYKFVACEFLGMLEQANGCDLAVIADAAFKADYHGTDFEGESVPRVWDRAWMRQFAASVILEALGAGVSWFDERERFITPSDGFDFVIPSFKFEQEAIDDARDGIDGLLPAPDALRRRMEALYDAMTKQTSAIPLPACFANTRTRNATKTEQIITCQDESVFAELRFPNIARACFTIAQDTWGGINRRRSTEQWAREYASFIHREKWSLATLEAIDAWLGSLSDEDMETVCVGEETEVALLLSVAPPETHDLLDDYFLYG